MDNTRRFIALIPARGGSKTVLRKNLREIAGKPLVAYSIEAAIASAHVSEVYLSSDDDEILAIGSTFGCNLVKRPEVFAGDDATATDVVTHFFNEVQNAPKMENLTVVYLQPTSPLRTAAHIDASIDAMLQAKCNTLVSVVKLDKSPFKSFIIDSNGALQSLFDEKNSNARRQDLPATYVPNGAIYIFDRLTFLARGGFPSNGSLPFIMSAADSIDIDTERDVEDVCRIMQEKRKEQRHV